MKIAVASGKGGTGKTTVAVSLALTLREAGRTVSLLDCDVEAPNAHLSLQPEFNRAQDVNRLIPKVDAAACTGCGRCAEVCQFHAIVVLGGQTLVFPELCHGCGSCTLECPDKAITEIPHKLGELAAGDTAAGIGFARGLLDIGQPMAVPIIDQLKQWDVFPAPDVEIWDSPPGASCPVVASIRGADYLLLVTEPTPFGLHDLKLAAQLAVELKMPAGVIINRDGVGNAAVGAFCEQAGLPILLRIPLDRAIGTGLAQGKPLVNILPEYRQKFLALYAQIEQHAAHKAGDSA